MKCGICGATEYTTRDRLGGHTTQIYDAYDLNLHKRYDHREEYQAQMQKMQDGRKAKQRADADFRMRYVDAGVKTSRDVIEEQGYADFGGLRYKVRLTSQLSRYDLYRCCYPEPVAYRAYQEIEERIADLQAQSVAALKAAHDNGTPVPEEDWQAVRNIQSVVV